MNDKIRKIQEYEAAIKLSAYGDLFFNIEWWGDNPSNKLIAILNVNDTFCYAADGEEIDWNLLPEFWEEYKQRGFIHTVEWVSKKRGGERPIPKMQKFLDSYEPKSIKETKLLFEDNLSEEHLDSIIKIYEKAFDFAANDDLSFFAKNNEIYPCFYGEKNGRNWFYIVEWEDLPYITDYKEYIKNNDLEEFHERSSKTN